VLQDLLAQLVQLVLLDQKALLDPLVPQVLQDLLEQQVQQDLKVQRDQRVQRDLKDYQVILVPQVPLVLLVLRDQLDRKVLQAL
jgi:hypothetical protein